MSRLFQKATELSADAKLSTKIGPAGVAALKTSGIPSTTTLRASDFLSNNWKRMNYFLKSIPSFFQKPYTMGKMITYAFIFLSVVVLGILFYKKFYTKEGFENSSYAYQKAFELVNSLKINSSPQINEDDNKLMYIQPVTFKQASYLGNQTFDSNLGILEQLRAGSRFFFLQIDYLEKDLGKEYGNAYEPVLVWKNNAGRMISKNSSSLKEVFSSIRNYFNNNNVPSSSSPIVLMLHFIRLPYTITNTEKYKNYLNKVFESLNVLDDLLIKGYSKASKEPELFSKKFNEFNKQIIVGTNINTSLTNNPSELNKKIHFQYYQINENNVDATDNATSLSDVNAVIYTADYVLSIKDSEKFLKSHNNKFVIVKPRNDQNLRKEDFEKLLNSYNVNVVLHDYFSDKPENVENIYKLYNNASYKIKTVF